MKKRDSRDRLRQGGRILLLIYLACVVYFMFFSEAYGRTDISPDYRYNLVLFREIRRFWQHRDILGTSAMLINIVGNVAMVIPFGFAVPLLFRLRGDRSAPSSWHFWQAFWQKPSS